MAPPWHLLNDNKKEWCCITSFRAVILKQIRWLPCSSPGVVAILRSAVKQLCNSLKFVRLHSRVTTAANPLVVSCGIIGIMHAAALTIHPFELTLSSTTDPSSCWAIILRLFTVTSFIFPVPNSRSWRLRHLSCWTRFIFPVPNSRSWLLRHLSCCPYHELVKRKLIALL